MAKPGSLPRWADGASAQIVEPPSGTKDTGWGTGEKPANSYFNWFWNLVYQWISYLDAGALEGDHSITGNASVFGALTVTGDTVLDELEVGGQMVQTASYALVMSASTSHDDVAIGDASIIFAEPLGTSVTVTSFAGGLNGRGIEIWNVGAYSFDLLNEYPGANTANRLACPGSANLTLAPGERAFARYDGNISRWRVAK